ncbi:MAG: hypothetical protein U9O98_04875, partial [Asgard group archaeon]|nr:hypothetical protein [Asgard group archaeon]
PKLAEKYQIDLLIMALPKNNESFIQTAKKTLDSGGRLICYITATENKLNEKLQEFNENNFHIIKKVKGISIAPFEWRYTIHLRKKGSKR